MQINKVISPLPCHHPCQLFSVSFVAIGVFIYFTRQCLSIGFIHRSCKLACVPALPFFFLFCMSYFPLIHHLRFVIFVLAVSFSIALRAIHVSVHLFIGVFFIYSFSLLSHTSFPPNFIFSDCPAATQCFVSFDENNVAQDGYCVPKDQQVDASVETSFLETQSSNFSWANVSLVQICSHTNSHLVARIRIQAFMSST